MRCSIAETNDVSIFRETVSPRTRRKLIICPSGCDGTSVSYDMRIDSNHFTCVCSECTRKWYICLNCPRQHTQYLKHRQLKRHQISCKSISNKLNYHPSTLSTDSISYFDFMKFPHFGGKENAEYYFHDQYNRGQSYIVGLSQYHLPNISTFLRPDEVITQIRIADLLLGLYPKQVQLLLKIMLHFNKKIKNSPHDNKWRCVLPTNSNLVRKFYRDGKYAIHSNLPHPHIQNVMGHSYVSLKHIIQDALANDCKFEDIYSKPPLHGVTSLNESSFCAELNKKFPSRKNTIDILLTRWSDDFEPYNIKQNKGNSVWAFTVTIYSKSAKRHCFDNTYVVSLGRKNDDHDCVEQLFINELNEINNDNSLSYYRKGSNQPISVRLHLVATICDLPERYSRCSITRGNGIHTSRWGYLCQNDLLQTYLATCEKCCSQLQKQLHHNPTSLFATECTVCSSWNMDNEKLLNSKISSKFVDSNTIDNDKIPARTSDFSNLKIAVSHTHKN